MKPIRFRNDKRLRDKLFTPENYLHPAKGHLGLWQTITEKYTAPGDTILDPMAGVGATLTAALMGRNVVCVELEPHWVTPMKASWEKMRQHPMLGHSLGEVLILRGDARALPLGSADHIVTSPPYEGSIAADNPNVDKYKSGGPFGDKSYTRPSAIITSPPYEGTGLANANDKADIINQMRRERGEIKGGTGRSGALGTSLTQARGYTRPVDAVVSHAVEITEMEEQEDANTLGAQAGGHVDRNILATRDTAHPSERMERVDMPVPMLPTSSAVDAVITSPPFQERKAYEGQPLKPATQSIQQGGFATLPHAVSDNPTNIGNLRGQAYWDSMRQVYQECHRVLKPNGILCLVLKGFTRDGKYVDLPQQTADLVESLGFTKFDEWQRELWSLSFWRILQGTDKEETVMAHRRGMFDLDIQEVKRMKRVSNGKLDDRLRFETVLAFHKG